MNQRKVVLYIATSLDGFIATKDGDLSWLSMVEKDGEDYGYSEFIKSVDTVIFGRKTYENVLSFGIEFPHEDKNCYVLSHSKTGTDGNGVTFFLGEIGDLIRTINEKPGKDIFCDEGAETTRELLQRDLIDSFIISIIPFLLGDGIRLFLPIASEQRKLKLVNSKSFSMGLVQLRYEKVK